MEVSKILVSIEKDIHEKLKTEALKQGCTVTDLVRRAIYYFDQCDKIEYLEGMVHSLKSEIDNINKKR